MSTDETERRKDDRPFSGPEQRQSRREELEAWWMLVARIIASIFGAVIVGITLLATDHEGLRFYAALAIGLGFMWPVVGVGVQQAFSVLRDGRGSP